MSLLNINFAALVGVQAVPLPEGYRGVVSFLILLTGLTASVGGSLAEIERDAVDGGPNADETLTDGD